MDPALSGARIQPRPRLARALHPLYSFPASARPRPEGADGAQDWVAGFCPLKDLIKALADNVPGVAEFVRRALARYKVEGRGKA